MKIPISAFAIGCALVALSPAAAQQTPQTDAPQPPYPVGPPAGDTHLPPTASSREAAARELLAVLGIEQSMSEIATDAIDLLLQDPETAPYRKPLRAILVEWSARHMSWETIAPSFEKLYMETFTETEMRQMIAFYKTPVGQKAIRKLPDLSQQGIDLANSILQPHVSELAALIDAKMKELRGPEAGQPDSAVKP